jgi:putative membrane-bound dehydrogenase-like protein
MRMKCGTVIESGCYSQTQILLSEAFPQPLSEDDVIAMPSVVEPSTTTQDRPSHRGLAAKACLFIFSLVSLDSLLLGQGYAPDEALGRMRPADGLDVQLIGSEPLVKQPVAIDFDDRGRLWVIQYLQYPNPAELKRVQVDRYSRTKYDRVPEPPPRGPKGADRITILQDTDGDGRMDHSKDFVSGLNLASGMAFGNDGVFVLNVPYLLFYPDRNRDDVPDSEPEVLLSGFGMEDAHSVANSLSWGPDGWLYGCQGSTVTARIQGIEFQQGVWRYHPRTREFELFCEGGGNSWGLDFDRHGQLYYSTNYGGHVLLHGVQGGYFVKAFAKHGELHNPYSYGYFEHASHTRFQGGHVTVGGVIYQGGSLPTEFSDKYIAGDLLGHTVQWHAIEPLGSTVRTVHGGELLRSNDNWFAPTDVTVGPDGAIYVADWTDPRTAHPDPDADWDRTNGRVYRIAPKASKGKFGLKSPDLASQSQEQLLEMHRHPNQWFVRRARQELARRHAKNGLADPDQLKSQLLSKALQSTEQLVALEALWTLNALEGFDEPLATQLLDSPHSHVRAWSVRFLGDRRKVSTELAHRLDGLAEQEETVEGRQQLACTAARLPADQALPIINANINRDCDNDDPRIPLLWWWAVERHSVSGRGEVLRRFIRPTLWKSKLGSQFLMPRLVRRYAAENSDEGNQSLVQLLKSAPDATARGTLWLPILQGLQQRPSLPRNATDAPASDEVLKPWVLEAWKQNPTNKTVLRLAFLLGLREPVEASIRMAIDPNEQASDRAALLELLSSAKEPALLEKALEWIKPERNEPETIRRAALQVLSHFEDPRVSNSLMSIVLAPQTEWLRSQAVDLMVSRVSFAHHLLNAVDRGEIEPSKFSLEQVRKISVLENSALNALVIRHWGRLEAASREEMLAEVRRLNNDLRASPGDPVAGKGLFRKHCASCHALHGEGEKIGPDLTSANRQDREYLLVSLVDPSSVIRKEYISVVVLTNDGRVLNGLPVARDGSEVVLVDAKSERVTIPRSEIADIKDSQISIMPSDLYRAFSPQQLRDLFAYLQRSP